MSGKENSQRHTEWPEEVRLDAVRRMAEGERQADISRTPPFVPPSTLSRWSRNAGLPARRPSEEEKAMRVKALEAEPNASKLARAVGIRPRSAQLFAQRRGIKLQHGNARSLSLEAA